MANGFKTGGRKKGSRNKRGAGAEALAMDILENPKYVANLKKRALAGELPPAVETMLFYYLYGKPVEKLEHSGNADKPLILSVRRAE